VEQFVHLLNALGALFAAPDTLLNAQARQGVRHGIARVQRDLQRPHGYLPTTVQALARKVSICMQHPQCHGALQARSPGSFPGGLCLGSSDLRLVCPRLNTIWTLADTMRADRAGEHHKLGRPRGGCDRSAVPKALTTWSAPVKLRRRDTSPSCTAAVAITLRIKL
jgi:hypothetical protein